MEDLLSSYMNIGEPFILVQSIKIKYDFILNIENSLKIGI